MEYFETNKEAWEHGFNNRKEGYGIVGDRIKEGLLSLEMQKAAIGHFCCNNGREISFAKSLPGVDRAVGFDIAENMISHAQETYKDCEFFACNILDVPEKFNQAFDVIMITVGALCWFENLQDFFGVVARCLKPGGRVFIHEIHPFENMLAMPGEDVDRHSYFKNDPWIQNNGMSYMTGGGESKTFISFSHTFGSIVTAMANNKIYITSLEEFDVAVSGMTGKYDNLGVPLSYTLIGRKMG